MPRTPVLERPTTLRALGVGFLVMVLFFVWLTWAFFNKAFVDSVEVTLTTTKAGSQLPSDADVKLRGMIVGEVRSVEPGDDGVTMTLAIKPEMMDEIPAGVSAQIVPKTLFGEKYVSLVPPSTPSGETLAAGDVITKAEVPIEVETVLNDLYTLLDAVDPADLSYTLSAVSDALSGRGEQLGTTLVDLNDYLGELNPDVELAVDDLVALGDVADVYTGALPDLGRLLENAVVTGDTIVSRRVQLSSFFAEAGRLSDTLTDFVATSGSDLVTVGAQSRRPLEITARYSTTFPCFLGALDVAVPRLDSVQRDAAVHINLEIINPLTPPTTLGGSPTPYAPDEVITGTNFDDPRFAGILEPTCLDLDRIAAGEEVYSQADGERFVPRDRGVYEIIGIQSPHGKFFDVNPDGSAGAPAGGGTADGVDSAQQRAALNRVIAASLGTDREMPDLASLLVGPVLRGSGVMLSEATDQDRP